MTAGDLQGKTVLVTGGAGFIGSHLVDALHPSNEVRVLDNLSTGTRENIPSDCELIVGDIRDEKTLKTAMRDVDVVFHEAAIVSVEQSINDPITSNTTNAGAVVTLLEEARRQDSRIVFASSAAIYGQPDSVPISESAPKIPSSPYGIDKLASDHYMRRYYELYDLPTIALRYFNVYGPRQSASDYSGVIDIFNQQAANGLDLTVNGDGTQTRDFVHVTDAVRANLRAATTSEVGEAYNIGRGESITIRELAETVRAVHDSNVDIIHREPRPGDIQHSRADVSKATSQLDFEPKIGLREGLERLTRESSGNH